MTFIQWRNDFSVDVAEIDRQHQAIIQMANELHDALQSRKGKEFVGEIIDRLFSYAQTHFIYEEKYFKEFNYPDAVIHISEHHKFVDRVFEFIKGYKKGKMGLSVEVLEFLKEWMDDHIRTFDKKYGPFFNEHGLK